MPTTSSTAIADRLVAAILARRLAPGTRLGEQQLSALFGVSRTLVREALMRLAARGIVTVSARRGWFVIEPSIDEAGEAFAARRVIELGLLRGPDRVDPAAIRRLKAHVSREKAALKASDVGARSFLLGDFHVCLAECLGSALLAEILRDLTARTTLIAMLYQPQDEAAHSCTEHAAIVAALERGDRAAAERLMAEHLEHVATGIDAAVPRDPLANLRSALAPVLNVRLDEPASRLHDRSLARSNRRRAGTGGRRART